MHIENGQVVSDLILYKRGELLLIKHLIDLFNYLIRWHVQLFHVLFEPSVEALDPVHSLLILEILRSIDILKDLFDEIRVEESEFDLWFYVFP